MSYSGQFYGSDPDDRDSSTRGLNDDIQDAEVVGETAGPHPYVSEEAIVANVDGTEATREREFGRAEGSDRRGPGFVATAKARRIGWWLTVFLPVIVIVARLLATSAATGTRWFQIFVTVPVFSAVVFGAMIGTQFATIGKRLSRTALPASIVATTAGIAGFYAFSPYLADLPERLPASYEWLALLSFLLGVAGLVCWLAEIRRAAVTVPDILAL